MEGWSDELKQETRKYLDGVELFPEGGRLHMKNRLKQFAYMEQSELLAGRIILHNKEDGQIVKFNLIDDLINSGWVVD